MSSIFRTEAVALRISRHSNTSHFVAWLTPDRGQMSTLVKGARRPKSEFFGQYDLFQSCELLYYERERNGTHIARSIAPIKTRTELRHDWRAYCAASYVCALSMAVGAPGSPDREMYGVLNSSLDALASGLPPIPILCRFETLCMKSAGWTPGVESCASCGHKLDSPVAPNAPIRFDSVRGGVVCNACDAHLPAAADTLSLHSVNTIRHWLRAGSQHPDTRALEHPRNRLLEIRRVMGTFIELHAHSPIRGRQLTYELCSLAGQRRVEEGQR